MIFGTDDSAQLTAMNPLSSNRFTILQVKRLSLRLGDRLIFPCNRFTILQAKLVCHKLIGVPQRGNKGLCLNEIPTVVTILSLKTSLLVFACYN
jgi:hypothetical protein